MASKKGRKRKGSERTNISPPRSTDEEPEFQRPQLGREGEALGKSIYRKGFRAHVYEQTERRKAEEQYEEAARGHEKPNSIYTPKSVITSSKGFYIESATVFNMFSEGKQVSPTYPDMPPSLRRETKHFNARAVEMVVGKWFSTDYVGGKIKERLGQVLPIVRSELNDFFKILGRVRGWAADGFYVSDTNLIYIQHKENEARGERVKVIVHELHHYAAWLGGGLDSIRWRSAGGKPIVVGELMWFHEGLTEFNAQQLTLEQGYEPNRVSYGPEVVVSSILQQLMVKKYGDAGKKLLRKSYFSGDFTVVSIVVDGELGAGTFGCLLGMENGIEGLAFLAKRLDQAGLNITFADDKVALEAMRQHPAFMFGKREERAHIIADVLLKNLQENSNFKTETIDAAFINKLRKAAKWEAQNAEEHAFAILKSFSLNPAFTSAMLNPSLYGGALEAYKTPLRKVEQRETFSILFHSMLRNPAFNAEWLGSERLSKLKRAAKRIGKNDRWYEAAAAMGALLKNPKIDPGQVLSPEAVDNIDTIALIIEQKSKEVMETRDIFSEIVRNPDFKLEQLVEIRRALEASGGDPSEVLKKYGEITEL